MIYLVNDIRVLSTKDWKKRHDISVEEFALENKYQVVDVKHDTTKPLHQSDFVLRKNDDDKEVYVFDINLYEKRTGIQQAKIELEEIKLWFLQNDFKPHKIITDEWEVTDPRWIEYLAERQLKRIKQDELNKIINGE
jgi:hypothetical protein